MLLFHESLNKQNNAYNANCLSEHFIFDIIFIKFNLETLEKAVTR